MKCPQARRLLTAGDPPSPALRSHLAACRACATYGRRVGAVHAALAEHHAAVTVPDGFASRVRARLDTDDNPLGWAALRLLPATVGLVLVLGWLNLRAAEPATDTLTDPTTAVLSWVLDPSDDEPSLAAEDDTR